MKYFIALALILTGLFFGYVFGVMPIMLLELTIVKSIMWAMTGCAVVGLFGIMSAVALNS